MSGGAKEKAGNAKEKAGNSKENGNGAVARPDSKRAMDRYFSFSYQRAPTDYIQHILLFRLTIYCNKSKLKAYILNYSSYESMLLLLTHSVYTACLKKSLDPFDTVAYFIEWVNTSRTDSIQPNESHVNYER